MRLSRLEHGVYLLDEHMGTEGLAELPLPIRNARTYELWVLNRLLRFSKHGPGNGRWVGVSEGTMLYDLLDDLEVDFLGQKHELQQRGIDDAASLFDKTIREITKQGLIEVNDSDGMHVLCPTAKAIIYCQEQNAIG